MSTKHTPGRGIEPALTSLASGLIIERDRLRDSNKELLEALQSQQRVVDELFKELGNKEAGNWGIINDGLCQAGKAIAKAERPV